MGYGDYQWFMKNDFSSYANKWIVIINKKVVASGKDINKIMAKVSRSYPNKTPFVTKVRNKLSIL